MNIPSKRRRLSAYLLDGMAYVLVLVICLQFKEHQTAIIILFGLFDLFYNVYLVYRFDGTPGKRLLGLAIQGIDGASITLWMAVKRHFSIMLLGLLLASPLFALSWMAGTDESQELYVSLADDVLWAVMLANVVTIFFNENRRALHDYVARTVVVATT